MFYYTYITRLQDSDKFYVGRHQSKRHPDADRYVGSGKWVRSIKDRSRLTREILQFFESETDLMVAEQALLSDFYGTDGCMNMNDRPTGFCSSSNPNKTLEARERMRQRLLTDNPMKGKKHTPEAIEKIRTTSTGRFHSNETKAKQSTVMQGKNVGKVRTAEHRAELSRIRKEDYITGRRTPNYGMRDKTHSEDAKRRMREVHQNRATQECTHCGGTFALCGYKRWHGDNCRVK